MADEPKGVVGSFADVMVDAGLVSKEDVDRRRRIQERARESQGRKKKIPIKKKAKRR